ncbi:MAG: alpha-ketoglutarate-dependent dioxygenase AlkB [Rickettsiales bacterium]
MGIQQIALFDDEKVSKIPGLTYIPEFIDQETEQHLINIIDKQSWITDLKRRVQHYGYRYDYKDRNVTPDLKLGNIPEWLMSYCKRLQREGFFKQSPDQVIINEYHPGQGIAPHIDCAPCFGETIASLSLGSACLMNFPHLKTKQTETQLLEQCSLVVLSNEARYEWQHSIAPRKTDKINGENIPRKRRLSLTFRTVLLKT